VNNAQRLSRAAALALAAGTLSVTGCKVGPNYTPPETAAPAAWSEQGLPTETSAIAAAKPVDTAWWSVLNDPTLVSLIDRSLAANNDLRLATERIRQARAERGIAASAGLPTVDANGSYARSRESENTNNGNFVRQDGSGSDTYRVGLDASWEIDVFGGVARSVEAAEGDIQALEENRRDVLVMLAGEVARNYVDLRGFQQRIEVTQRNVQIQTDTLSLTESRYKAGLTSELDVVQARAQLEQTRAALPPLDENARAAIHRLGVLAGREPGSLLDELNTAAALPTAPAEIPVGLPSELVRRRPDIRRAEREIAAQTARVGVATSDLFPKFSLTGGFGLASSQIGTLGDGDSRFWAIGPAVRWPVFQGGAIRANIEVQKSLTKQSLIAYDQTVLIAFEDVENALVSFARQQSRRKSLAEAVVANRRAVELATTLNRAGLADFQRVLSSQLSLAVSEESLVASDQAVLQALVRLYKSLGGGWESLEATEQARADIREPTSPDPAAATKQ
jgi:NodT family efflux transporter outer membrane factor (OMF) lipoprotein